MSRSTAKTLVGALVTLALLAVLFASTGASARDPGVTYASIRGSDRHDTAIRISNTLFAGALPTGSGVVLAPGETFQEALCGGPLAAAWGGSVLLTYRAALANNVKAELQRLLPSRVFCIGMTSAVVAAVQAALPTATVTAINGTGPTADIVYDMSRKVANALAAKAGSGGKIASATAIITVGTTFPDALGVGPLACSNLWPIVLTNSGGGGTLHVSAAGALSDLGITKALKVGTYATLPVGVTGQGNLSGSDRYATNRNVAQWASTNAGLLFTHLGVATGDKFPDALAAGPYLAADDGVLLLSPLRGPVPAPICDLITDNRDAVQHVTFIACIEPVIGQVKALLPAVSSGSQPLGANVAITFPLFPADSPWNTDISGYPVHPLSGQFIASIGVGGHLHPDFGTVWDGAPNGIPYVVVSGDQARVPVTFEYDDESDPGPYPIPPDPPIEGGPDGDGDRHVLILDAGNRLLYELYSAYPAGDHWEAGSGAIFDLNSNALRPEGWTSADAAGLPILPGLVRYDEVASGEITHALRFTVSSTQRAYIHPATHFASSSTSSNLPPMGLRLRLRADYDIYGYPDSVQVILRALKKYGMIVADNGSSWYISGAPDPRWDDDALHTLQQVPGSAFEAVYTGPTITP